MKKTLAITLLLVLLSSLPVRAATTEEITFRGVPWGITLEEAAEIVSQEPDASDVSYYGDLGFDEDIAAMLHMPQGASAVMLDPLFTFYESVEIPDVTWMYYESFRDDDDFPQTINVAGHQLYAHLYGLCRFDDSEISEDALEAGDCRFFMGAYEDTLYGSLYDGTSLTPVEDRAKITADLLEKLTAVYGEPDKVSDDGKTAIWYGANETAVKLRCSNGIAIEYWDLSVSDMVKSLYRLSTGEELYDLSGL